MIQTIEELSMNAWPALQTILLDGWILRFASGYTRRANSVSALYPGSQAATEKITECERLYHAQGLPAIFKLAGEDESRDLDDLLAGAGYQAEAATSVQTVGLQQTAFDCDPRVRLADRPDEQWEDAFARLSGLAEDRKTIHHSLLSAILPQTCYVSLVLDGRVQACGLGVLQAGYVGIFDIVVAAEVRRQGLGEGIMRTLLSWAQQNGAHSAYLQVMKNNPPALSLYARLGFREIYPYWYRVKN